MSFIDWSDSEGMLELLVEFVRDARNESSKDRNRQRFLSTLLKQLNDLVEGSNNTKETIDRLTIIYQSIEQEFQNDAVVIHIRDCLEELKRNT
jgi:hypothetical protein